MNIFYLHETREKISHSMAKIFMGMYKNLVTTTFLSLACNDEDYQEWYQSLVLILKNLDVCHNLSSFITKHVIII